MYQEQILTKEQVLVYKPLSRSERPSHQEKLTNLPQRFEPPTRSGGFSAKRNQEIEILSKRFRVLFHILTSGTFFRIIFRLLPRRSSAFLYGGFPNLGLSLLLQYAGIPLPLRGFILLSSRSVLIFAECLPTFPM